MTDGLLGREFIFPKQGGTNMTADIVERLRSYKPYRIGEGEWFGPKVCEEAASLIESLRSDNAAIREAMGSELHELIQDRRWADAADLPGLIARSERLEAALSRIQERG